MRWPFRRRRPAPSVAGSTTRSEPAAWRSLPTIHRAVEPIEPSAHSEDFVHDLGTRRPLDHYLAPLGHDVRTEAPGGIATGIASMGVARSEGPELDFSHPPSREGSHEPSLARTVDGWPAAVQRSASTAGPAAPDSGSAPAGRMPEVAPLRVLRAAAQTPAERAVADQPAAEPVTAAAQIAREAEPEAEAEAEIVPETAPASEVARASEPEDEGEDQAAPSEGSDASATVTESAAAREEPSEGAPVQRAADPQAPLVGKRLGLGDPLQRRPDTAREIPPEDADLPLAPRQGAEGRGEAGIAGASGGEGTGPAATIHREWAAPAASAEGESGAAEVQRTEETGATEVQTAGAANVQRTEQTGAAGETPAAPVAGSAPPLARTRGVRLMRAGEGSESGEQPAEEAPRGFDLPLPRRLAALPAETRSRESDSAAAGGEATRVQRAEALPPPRPASVQRASDEGAKEASPVSREAAPTPEEAGDEIVPELSEPSGAEAPARVTEGAEAQDQSANEATEAAPAVAPLVSARPLARLQRAAETEEEFVGRGVTSPGLDLGGPAVQRAPASSEAAIHRSAASGGAASPRAAASGGAAPSTAASPARSTSLGSVTQSVAAFHPKGSDGTPLARQLFHAPSVQQLSRAPSPEETTEGLPGPESPESVGRAFDPAFVARSEFEPMPLAMVSRKAEPASEPAPAGQWLARAADTAAAAVAAGVATSDGNGSVVFRAPDGNGFAPATVQRQEETATEATTGTAAPAAPTETASTDVEELANKLWEPLRNRLREELLLLRERIGRLADL